MNKSGFTTRPQIAKEMDNLEATIKTLEDKGDPDNEIPGFKRRMDSLRRQLNLRENKTTKSGSFFSAR